jgi:tetratricopeptide (TPR) repeat protein
LGQELLDLAEREDDPRMRINGHLVIGSTLMFGNDLQGGLDHLDRAISLFPAVPLRSRSAGVGNDPRVACLTTSAITLWLMGFPDRAVERANAALALGAELDHPFTSAFAHFHSGLVHLWRREPDIALQRALRLAEIADEHDFQIWTAAGGSLLGAAQVELGRFDEGLANVSAGMDLYQGLRSPPVFWPMLLFLRARASYRAGRPADGVTPLETAIEFMSPGDGTTLLPELYILKGDLLTALAAESSSRGSPGEPWYRRAFERAGQLNARTAQLRAAVRLAALMEAAGEPEEAARTLGPVYARFSEGFATADLQEARELLDVVDPSEHAAT